MNLLAAALVALALAASPAVAASPAPDHVLSDAQTSAACGAVGDVTSSLAAQYGERIVWWGRTAGGVTMIVTQRPDAKTWTLLAVHDGVACMVGSGGTGAGVGS